MSKKTYHHGDLRNSLLQTARTMINRDGIAGVSLRAIAREAEVSSAAPYRHFEDKTALLEAVAEDGFRVLIQACEDAEAAHPDDPRAQFFAMGYASIRPVLSFRFTAGPRPPCAAHVNQAGRSDCAHRNPP